MGILYVSIFYVNGITWYILLYKKLLFLLFYLFNFFKKITMLLRSILKPSGQQGPSHVIVRQGPIRRQIQSVLVG